MKGIVFYAFLVIMVIAVACSDDVNPNKKSSQEDSVIVAYLDSQMIDYDVDDNGIYSYSILLNDTGKTQSEGSVLSIYYRMQVLNGQLLIDFDSTDGDPLKVKQGADAIYPIGVDKALRNLKRGEKWGFVLPSKHAYGMFSSALIPPNSSIIFEATLVEIQNESQLHDAENKFISAYMDSVDLADTVGVADSLIIEADLPKVLGNDMIYKRLTAGSPSTPNAGDTVIITYEIYYPYKESEKVDVTYAGSANPFVFTFNNGEVIEGLDAAVGQMSLGERALFIMPSSVAYKESAAVLPDYLTGTMAEQFIVPTYAAKVGPYEVLIFEVSLIQIN